MSLFIGVQRCEHLRAGSRRVGTTVPRSRRSPQTSGTSKRIGQVAQPNSELPLRRDDVPTATASEAELCAQPEGLTSLTALRMTPAPPSPVGHPLIRQLPNSNTAKRLARHRVPTLRAEVRPYTEQHSHPRAVPKRPVNAAAPRPINPIPH